MHVYLLVMSFYNYLSFSFCMEVFTMVPLFASGSIEEPPALVLKFLNDPTLNSEVKSICFRLSCHKFIQKLLEKTPATAIFRICEEYKKHPDLYDEIFSGKLKFFLKGSMNNAEPFMNTQKINQIATLQGLFEPDTLIRQVVDKFESFEFAADRIKRIAIEINGDKMLTVAFNEERKIVSLFEDYIKIKGKQNAFLNFINRSTKKRVDFIRN